MLFEFPIDQTKGQHRAVDGQIHPFEQIRQCTDVVLVSMREHNPADLIRIALHKGEIRQHQVYAQHIVVWERHAAVDDQHIALTLVEGKVFPDLIQAAQKVNPDGRLLRSAVLPALFSPRGRSLCFLAVLVLCLFRLRLFRSTAHRAAL